MNNLGINKITIKGFLSQYNVDIPLSDNIKILVGENGLGKTQILNIIYATLSRKFEKLLTYSFEEVIIYFNDDSLEVVNKSEIQTSLYTDLHPILNTIADNIGIDRLRYLQVEIQKKVITRGEFIRSNIARELSEFAPLDYLYDLLRNFTSHKFKEENLFTIHLSNVKNKITKAIQDSIIIYFPTFRRVEEDLKNLGYDEEQFKRNREDSRLINFGMDDVQRRFDSFTEKIDKLSKEGFAKLSGEILSQLVSGMPEGNRDFLERMNANDIQIILERIGKEMSTSDKERIIEMINSKEVLTKDKFLLYFLEKLIDIYDQQREYDSLIKEFVRISNAYLVKKKVYYDESGLKIYIKSENSNEKLLLSKLSSGEKQIISILSRIYLSPKEHKYIVLFDEPELSLSIFWQRMLLPDIMNSGKCNFLVAVTHSPFIFENELDKYAIGLNDYFTSLSNESY
jgi:predicted ATP-binding protein involved in virulence